MATLCAHAPTLTLPLASPVVRCHGFSLPELLVCLVVIGLVATQGLAVWQSWRERLSLEAVRDQLIMDLQSARVQALQRGQSLRLQALNDCPWRSRSGGDWSCGWQLVVSDGDEVLLHSPLHQPLSLLYTKSTPLEISARGELGQVGDRWTAQPLTSGLRTQAAAQSVCLSGGGRVRWVAAATCS